MRFRKDLKKFVWFGALPLSIFFVVLFVPFAQGIFLTFTDWDGFDYEQFVGFDNYVRMFGDKLFQPRPPMAAQGAPDPADPAPLMHRSASAGSEERSAAPARPCC